MSAGTSRPSGLTGRQVQSSGKACSGAEVARICRCDRAVRTNDDSSSLADIVAFIDPEKAPAPCLFEPCLWHREVEDRSRRSRDTTFGENASQARKGHGLVNRAVRKRRKLSGTSSLNSCTASHEPSRPSCASPGLQRPVGTATAAPARISRFPPKQRRVEQNSRRNSFTAPGPAPCAGTVKRTTGPARFQVFRRAATSITYRRVRMSGEYRSRSDFVVALPL